jgi:hypothetical protein
MKFVDFLNEGKETECKWELDFGTGNLMFSDNKDDEDYDPHLFLAYVEDEDDAGELFVEDDFEKYGPLFVLTDSDEDEIHSIKAKTYDEFVKECKKLKIKQIPTLKELSKIAPKNFK